MNDKNAKEVLFRAGYQWEQEAGVDCDRSTSNMYEDGTTKPGEVVLSWQEGMKENGTGMNLTGVH
jgi:hypothetical protein